MYPCEGKEYPFFQATKRHDTTCFFFIGEGKGEPEGAGFEEETKRERERGESRWATRFSFDEMKGSEGW